MRGAGALMAVAVVVEVIGGGVWEAVTGGFVWVTVVGGVVGEVAMIAVAVVSAGVFRGGRGGRGTGCGAAAGTGCGEGVGAPHVSIMHQGV